VDKCICAHIARICTYVKREGAEIAPGPQHRNHAGRDALRQPAWEASSSGNPAGAPPGTCEGVLGVLRKFRRRWSGMSQFPRSMAGSAPGGLCRCAARRTTPALAGAQTAGKRRGSTEIATSAHAHGALTPAQQRPGSTSRSASRRRTPGKLPAPAQGLASRASLGALPTDERRVSPSHCRRPRTETSPGASSG
jgi:hypothetical protein